jgi:hypothetical protein
MRNSNIIVLVLAALIGCVRAYAQKPFSEGIIVYQVQLSSPDNKVYKGTLTFTFKNGQVRKDLKLDNGFADITLINANKGTIYTLQERNGRKYAIQLSMEDDVNKKQKRFRGFTVANEARYMEQVAGYTVYSGTVVYKDSSLTEVLYNKDWKPEVPYTWNRFPDAQFIPLRFAYKDDNGIQMAFAASKMEESPIQNSVFAIPADYKMISNEEYRQLLK